MQQRASAGDNAVDCLASSCLALVPGALLRKLKMVEAGGVGALRLS